MIEMGKEVAKEHPGLFEESLKGTKGEGWLYFFTLSVQGVNQIM